LLTPEVAVGTLSQGEVAGSIRTSGFAGSTEGVAIAVGADLAGTPTLNGHIAGVRRDRWLIRACCFKERRTA
jgi:hypothetical protein